MITWWKSSYMVDTSKLTVELQIYNVLIYNLSQHSGLSFIMDLKNTTRPTVLLRARSHPLRPDMPDARCHAYACMHTRDASIYTRAAN